MSLKYVFPVQNLACYIRENSKQGKIYCYTKASPRARKYKNPNFGKCVGVRNYVFRCLEGVDSELRNWVFPHEPER